jgi:hypothetical protein
MKGLPLEAAGRQLEEMAGEGNPAVQMVLPMAEMVGWLREGVGALIRQAGLRVMELLMEEDGLTLQMSKFPAASIWLSIQYAVDHSALVLPVWTLA